MRRSDHDVTNTVRTTDLQQVAEAVLRVYRGLYEGTPSTLKLGVEPYPKDLVIR